MRQSFIAVSLIASCAITITACNRAADVHSVRLTAPDTVSRSTTVGSAPMFAVSPSGDEAIAWISAPNGGTDGRLYISVNKANPVELTDTLGPIEPHGESPPKIAYAPDGSLDAIYVVTKVEPGRRFPLAALRFVRSTDGGRTWSAPVTVTSDAVFGSHNFHALHVAANGETFVSWLGGPGPKSAAWIAHSSDNGSTWTAAVRPDSGEACPCCRTALATSADGTLYMGWRKVFPGNIRDVVIAKSGDGGQSWTEPVRVHADNWMYDGCPHAGPSIQVDSKGVVHVAWWVGKEGAAGTYYAHSSDGGVTFSEPVGLGVAQFSKPAHVQLAVDSQGDLVAVTWDDGTLKVPNVVLRTSRDGGSSFDAAQTVSDPTQAGTFPVISLTKRGMAIAWTQKSSEAVAHEEHSMPNMKDPNTAMGLSAVGAGHVLVRRQIIGTGSISSSSAAFVPLAVGDAVAPYSARSMAGDSVRIGPGEPLTFVNVWATWCTSCREEMADLETLRKKFAARGLRVVAVSVDEGDGERVRRFVEHQKLGMTIVHDPAARVQEVFATVGVPESYLVSSSGKLLWRQAGGIHGAPENAQAAIEQALNGAVPAS